MFNDLLNIAFPSLCIHCHSNLLRGEDFLCVSCQLNLPILPKDGDITHLLSLSSVSHVKAYLAFDKKGVSQQILHEIKYKDNRLLAIYFGRYIATLTDKDYCAIVPIPLHPKKLKLRGYNQSLELAKGIKEILKTPIKEEVVQRTKHTQTQTKKSKEQRQENMKQAFQSKHIPELENKRILLIDDVITTGVTIEECAKEIKRNNPTVEIDVICLAYAKM